MYLKNTKLTNQNLIFNFKDIEYVKYCFKKMNSSNSLQKGRDARLHGYLYLLLSQLLEESGEGRFLEESECLQDLYVKKAIEYIRMNYSRKVSINELSDYIGISRGYLCLLFKKHLNASPQEFLVGFRMDKACELMRDASLTIGDISRSVGYEDPLVFSKIFKKVKGLPPKSYRNK